MADHFPEIVKDLQRHKIPYKIGNSQSHSEPADHSLETYQ